MSLIGSSGLKSAFSVAALAGQDIVARSISLTQAAAGVAIQMVTGAKLKLGTGTNDFLTSDGANTITAAGSFNAGSFGVTSGAGYKINGQNTGMSLDPGTGNVSFLSNGTQLGTMLGASGALSWGFPGVFTSLTLSTGTVIFSSFSDGSGTTGNQTLNFARGICAIAAAGTSVTIGNSFVTATSTVLCVLQTNDATARLANVVPGSGTFTINLTAAATGTTKIAFIVLN